MLNPVLTVNREVYIAHLPVDNALVLSDLREYRHKCYIARNQIL